MHTSNVRRGIRGASWSSVDSADLYQVSAWGQGYFDVSADGHVVVRPHATDDAEIDLLEVVHGLRERDLSAPKRISPDSLELVLVIVSFPSRRPRELVFCIMKEVLTN